MIFPSNIRFLEIGMREHNQVSVSRTAGLYRDRSKKPGHAYAFSVVTQEYKYGSDEAMDLMCFMESLQGPYHVFDIVFDVVSFPRGNVKNEAGKAILHVNGTDILTGGWTPNRQNLFKRGDVIRFSNHSKVYRINNYVSSDANGNASINLTKPLLKPLSGGEFIQYNGVPFTVALDSEPQDVTLDGDQFIQYEFDCMETPNA